MSDEEVALLERLGMAYLESKLPAWVWLSLQTVAVFKSAERVNVRLLAEEQPRQDVPQGSHGAEQGRAEGVPGAGATRAVQGWCRPSWSSELEAPSGPTGAMFAAELILKMPSKRSARLLSSRS